MAKFAVSLENAKFDVQIADVRQKALDQVRKVTELASDRIVKSAKEIVPVDTGRLRDSIKYELIEDGFSSLISANTEYASFIEFGTTRMRAQPYLIPSLEKEKPFYLDELTKALKSLG